jgi:putative transposase
VIRKHNIAGQHFYGWRAMYGGIEVSDARKLKGLEAENSER